MSHQVGESPLVLKVKRLRGGARLPTKAHDDDAAFDLYAVNACYFSKTTMPVPTGIACEIPPGWFAQILGRSSLAARGITPLGGCIDSGFRGEWVVTLLATGREMEIRPGDRIAQFVLLPVPHAVIEDVDELSPAPRGDGGFGSTGR